MRGGKGPDELARRGRPAAEDRSSGLFAVGTVRLPPAGPLRDEPGRRTGRAEPDGSWQADRSSQGCDRNVPRSGHRLAASPRRLTERSYARAAGGRARPLREWGWDAPSAIAAEGASRTGLSLND